MYRALKRTNNRSWLRNYQIIDINKYLEYRKYVEMGFHNAQFNFRLDLTTIGEIFQGESPGRNRGKLKVVDPPVGYSVSILLEMPNEHSPGLQI